MVPLIAVEATFVRGAVRFLERPIDFLRVVPFAGEGAVVIFVGSSAVILLVAIIRALVSFAGTFVLVASFDFLSM